MLTRIGRRRPSGRAVVWIVAVVALVSFVTGLAAILTEPTTGATGVLGDLQSVVEFSGTVVGFALLVTAWGMRRGYRVAYVAAAVLVFLSAAHGVAQSRLLSVPLVIVSVGGLVVLVFTSDRFTRSSALTATQLGSLLAIVGVLCYGTAGAYALREGFDELDTVVDAVYFTLVTASTVGYGDIHPTTEGARLFAVSLVVLGPATVAVAVGSLFGPALETRLSRAGDRATKGKGSSDTERVVILGSDDVIPALVEGLSTETAVVVGTEDDDLATRLRADDVEAFVGEPTGEELLERADLESADAVIVATGDGAQNQDVALSVRDRTPTRLVVLDGGARADESDDRANTLERADVVVLDSEEVIVNATVDATLEGETRGRRRRAGDPSRGGQTSASAAAHSE